jgi:hypothetical protein
MTSSVFAEIFTDCLRVGLWVLRLADVQARSVQPEFRTRRYFACSNGILVVTLHMQE